MIPALRRRLAAAMGCALLLLTVGCAPMIPTDGPVGTSDPEVGGDFEYVFDPRGPQEGDSPEEIVRYFIQAGVGVQDDYAVAREYMTAEAAAEWTPGERTVVYSTEPRYFPGEDDTFTAQMEVESQIDSSGIMTSLPENSTEAMEFTLTEVEGEWRISDAPSGTMLPYGQFQRVYAAHTLYFYDPQLQYAVPDLRWFVNRPGLPAEIVSALLDGPAPYLSPAVVSGFPSDARLSRASVPVEDGVAQVDFDNDIVAGLSDEERALMQHQIDLVLTQLSAVRDVQVTVDQREISAGDGESADDLDIDVEPAVDATQVGIHDGTLMRQSGLETMSINNLPDVSDLEPQQPAMPDEAADVYAFLDGEGSDLYHVGPDLGVSLSFSGEDLVRPSMDNFGWTWTASNASDEATVHALPYDESLPRNEVQVSVDWLEGRSITSLRISQDGARAAVVVDDGGERTLYMTGVIRDSEGAPQGLAEPMRMETTTDIEEVRWSENNSLVVWENSEDEARQVERVTISGTNEPLGRVLLGLQNVSAGEGERNIFAETVDYPQQTFLGETWDVEDLDIRDMSYPG
ncbi:MAG TPA: GerMN domain-containing protein [Candidatus Nesterenkonia stercoripullorum]|uniref:GerMN domain-containing protein n=1 Tax=Candidatus Nesterenkonia stercoripullorum TaxID=2838701 RepID=A0A9D1USR4_9MICC|nr:GerMN domain-containing protein [Candidatus Nesterenkonia stercoripullorum]